MKKKRGGISQQLQDKSWGAKDWERGYMGLSLPIGLSASVNSPRLRRFSHSVLSGCRSLISAWACKSTPHVNTSRHVIIGTRPSPSLFLHGCETKAGVGRTGNEANNMYY